ncbi:hypothetical protein PHLGIDRAFT_126305 [Phlebiopsis gigantea 11061_1 CR5-6]|uniref:BTB domain-containing protein n=1 Tax=Phlebiopsis gigantea (strain 11061_1 CR5-6) TaxID=745531 RepID=A0A0C3SAQ1_PHLG1|nr:hypothetical protein PHLGIDRAFT_126305 [Phlebiopsis gigantea 11061_1 CR5-6]
MFPTAIRVGPQPGSGTSEDCVAFISSDNVLFHVSKDILVEASPFFRDMLSLQQPSGSEMQDVIPFPEDSIILQILLQLCFDLVQPAAKDIPTICRVLDAARKYQLRDAREAAKNWIWSHVNSSPLEVYAFACRYDLEEEAAAAAEVWKDRYTQKYRRADSCFTMSIEGASYIPEMDEISSGAFFRLLQYVRAPADSVDWRPFSFVRPQFSSAYRNAQKRLDPSPHAVPAPAAPLPAATVQSPDFVLKSTDGLECRVHRLILALAGGQRLLDAAAEESADGLPLCRVGAIGWVLALVVELCYPLGAPGVFQDLFAAQEILRFASKYEMAPILEIGKAQLSQILHSAPLRVYFIAAENGWIQQAEQSARILSTQLIEDQYVPEMENVSARAYYRLLRYYHECRTVINRITCRHSDYVQGWKMVAQNRQRTKASSMVPLPIVEMWTQKLLAAQCPRPSDHRAAPVTPHKRRRQKGSDDAGRPIITLDLQADFVDATQAMETEIRDELMQVQPRLDQP